MQPGRPPTPSSLAGIAAPVSLRVPSPRHGFEFSAEKKFLHELLNFDLLREAGSGEVTPAAGADASLEDVCAVGDPVVRHGA